MKNMILILSIFFFITGCSEEDTKKQNELPTENATIYYHPLGLDICIYLIKTDSNYHYTVENLEETFREYNLRVKISYTETNKIMSCGFGGPTPVIKIVTIEKI